MSKTRRQRIEAKLTSAKENLKSQVEVMAKKNRKQAGMLADRNGTLRVLVSMLTPEQHAEIEKLDDEKHAEVKKLVKEFMP